MTTRRAWIGLGSNQGDSAALIEQALDWLNAHEAIEVTARSSLYRTPPWGRLDQPDFINAAAALTTSLSAQPLIDVLLHCERHLGRVRDESRWGPRLIDLDLLLMEQGSRSLEVNELRVQLPHPRMHERAFVLVPLAELDATVVIPGHGTVQQCLDRAQSSGIERLT